MVVEELVKGIDGLLKWLWQEHLDVGEISDANLFIWKAQHKLAEIRQRNETITYLEMVPTSMLMWSPQTLNELRSVRTHSKQRALPRSLPVGHDLIRTSMSDPAHVLRQHQGFEVLMGLSLHTQSPTAPSQTIQRAIFTVSRPSVVNRNILYQDSTRCEDIGLGLWQKSLWALPSRRYIWSTVTMNAPILRQINRNAKDRHKTPRLPYINCNTQTITIRHYCIPNDVKQRAGRSTTRSDFSIKSTHRNL